jgi:hypothetical protein
MTDHSRRALVALATTLSLVASPALAQSAAALEGVWKVTKVVATGANPLDIPNPAPSLYIFSRGHYANVADTSRTPRTSVTFKDAANPTDAERLAKYQEWNFFAAQAGTYEVKGSTITRSPVVAKNVAAIAPYSAEYRLTGDTLVLTSQAPAGQPAREQVLTLTRVK